jgi:hypothetical protein
LLAFVAQITGLVVTAIGITIYSIPAGIIFTGFALILIGLAIEKGK